MESSAYLRFDSAGTTLATEPFALGKDGIEASTQVKEQA